MPDSQYHKVLEDLMGIPFEELVTMINMEPLKEKDEENPLDALKPVIGKLQVITEGIINAQKRVEKFKELGQLNKAQDIILKEIKPKLFESVYLRQIVIDSTRPEMGKISEDGNFYHSTFLSVMYGEEVKIPLKGYGPQQVIEEAHAILSEENLNQKRLYGHIPFPSPEGEAQETPTTSPKPIVQEENKQPEVLPKEEAKPVVEAPKKPAVPKAPEEKEAKPAVVNPDQRRRRRRR